MSNRALLQADVILLIGARLNWILHFGLPPRFDPNVKIIQVLCGHGLISVLYDDLLVIKHCLFTI